MGKVICLGASLVFVAESSAAIVFATGPRIPLYLLDTDTGLLERIDTDEDFANELRVSLTRNPADRGLYANNNRSGVIERFNFDSGEFETILTLPPTGIGFGEFVFDSVGQLYAQNASSSVGATGPVGVFDITGGGFTAITADLPRLFASSFRPKDGLLYAVSSNRTLFKINPVTGEFDDTVTISIDGAPISDIVFLPSGEAVVSYFRSGGGGALATLDLDSGETSNVRLVQDGLVLHGLTLIPEPSCSILILGSVILLLGSRTR